MGCKFSKAIFFFWVPADAGLVNTEQWTFVNSEDSHWTRCLSSDLLLGPDALKGHWEGEGLWRVWANKLKKVSVSFVLDWMEENSSELFFFFQVLFRSTISSGLKYKHTKGWPWTGCFVHLFTQCLTATALKFKNADVLKKLLFLNDFV